MTSTSFESALDEFRAAIGAEHVSTDEPTRREFSDTYSPESWTEYLPPAVLQPSTTEEVQEIVRIANRHGVELWANGQGRNNGYGGSAPRHPGTVVVNLRRMNRVLEVNEEFSYVVVEPGVSFNDMWDYNQKHGHTLWVDTPDIGWGSLVGNSLEHGFGYTPNGDRANSVCGMEVVLPNGELLRTGMGAMTDNPSWHLSKRGFGPMLDSLFMQSNYGIVTKMGLWCMPQPEYYLTGWVTIDDDENLPALLDAVRPLMIDRTIPNYPSVFTASGALAVVGKRSDFYDGEGPIPFEVSKAIVATIPNLGIWNLRFALYGKENVVDAQFENIKAALSTVPGIDITGTKMRSDEMDPETLDQSGKVQAGIPDMQLLNTSNWAGGVGGHIGFSTVLPLTGRDGRKITDLVRPASEEAGFDYIGGFLLRERSMMHVTLMVYDTADEPAAARARDLCGDLVTTSAAMGYGEYRAHPSNMDNVQDTFDFNDHAMRRFYETIKDAIDPNGILAPGKQGIWPRRLRDKS
jgi:4-cresol dehydrogenase (hydroxylating) flavoprotein subunit